MKYVTVDLTARDVYWLTVAKPVHATGGQQSLNHRVRSGMRVKKDDPPLTYRGYTMPAHTLTISEEDLERLPGYWAKTGGKPGCGGFQRRLPMESLRDYLPTVSPLFGAAPLVRKKPVSYVYFKEQRVRGDGRIKIGRGQRKRATTGRSTDNPNELVVLLRLVETDEQDEAYYHKKFAHLRIRADQEWFWPGDDLIAFIHAEAAKQKLSE